MDKAMFSKMHECNEMMTFTMSMMKSTKEKFAVKLDGVWYTVFYMICNCHIGNFFRRRSFFDRLFTIHDQQVEDEHNINISVFVVCIWRIC
jgi:hypothetical protein